jgi:hypothetical protein
MNKVAAAILIVLAMLALGYPRRDLVIAETEKVASVFGYELQFRLKLQLAKLRTPDPLLIDTMECVIVADTLEAP